MRRGQNPEIIRGEDGKVVALFLSADFCAEHEWGIDGLKKIFDIRPASEAGIDRRRARLANGKNLRLVKRDDYSVLIGMGGYIGERLGEEISSGKLDKREMSRRFELSIEGYRSKETAEIAASWCGDSFGVMVPSRNDSALREVYEAFLAGDGAIFVGGARLPVFDNGGLVLAIVSRIPEEVLKSMRESDMDRDALKEASDATGILKRIEKHNEGKSFNDPSRRAFYACSPSWITPEMRAEPRSILRGRETKYDVIYFLNPQEQRSNNFGWFTVEELDEWLAGRGPIIMTPEQVASGRRG